MAADVTPTMKNGLLQSMAMFVIALLPCGKQEHNLERRLPLSES